MNSTLIKYGLLLFLLPVLQVSIFNNIDLLGYIDPYFYIIFIFLFPFDKNKALFLISSFILGIFIDLLTNDGGIHAFSIVFIAYLRMPALRIISGKGTIELDEINIKTISLSVLFFWIVILTFLHHFLIFSLEQFSFNHFGKLISKTLITSTFSIILILISLQLFSGKKTNA